MQMVIHAERRLSLHKDHIDALNVFPVPDGDTGTNMHLTLSSGVSEVKKHESAQIGIAATSFSKGLLMGARGNSGVILSQLFRGFAKAIENDDTVSARAFAAALQKGVDTAYKAVMKPVEGTILTVAKKAAKKAKTAAVHHHDIIAVMETTLREAKTALEQTPNLLPVLKEVGVVDSGGQGLVVIYEAFLAVLKGEEQTDRDTSAPSMEEMVKAEHHRSAQMNMNTEDIEYGYCTEFIVKLTANETEAAPFHEEDFRSCLSERGDSLLVVSDDKLVKVHIHSEYPGDVLTYAQQFGELVNIKIENMREQHLNIVRKDADRKVKSNGFSAEVEAEYGIVAVAAGEGLVQLFKSIGANEVIHGGQTMNPSTEDIAEAVNKVDAKTVYVLPNNSNIQMAAEQAASIVDNKKTIVIPTKTIPQGMTSLFVFNPKKSVSENEKAMIAALKRIKSGQVTYAVRDTVIDGLTIHKGDWLGISEEKIMTSSDTSQMAAKELLQHLISEESELVTIIYGEDVSRAETEQLVTFIESQFPNVDVEVHAGMQPIYPYLISVE